MKALSLWQPWGSLWLSPCKLHETRDWYFGHRGWLLVHATKKFVRDVDGKLSDILDDQFGPHWGLELPTGALIGAVNVVDCRATAVVRSEYLQQFSPDNMPDDFYCGDFSDGRYATQRREYKVFRQPIPYKGHQGPFDVPYDIVCDAMQAEDVTDGSVDQSASPSHDPTKSATP